MIYALGHPVEEPDLCHPVHMDRFPRRIALALADTGAVGADGAELAALYEPIVAAVQRLDIWHVGFLRLGGPRDEQIMGQPAQVHVCVC